MHACPLDVLHHSWDDHHLTVGDRVDLDLDPLQVLVDEHGSSRHRADGPGHVAPELADVVDNLHRPPTQHVGRPDEDRIAHALGDGDGVLDGRGGTSNRLRDADGSERVGERAAILGQIDGAHARSEHGHATALKPLGQVDGRLSAELHQGACDLLGLSHQRRAIFVKRIEVEAVRRVEVRGDCLGVRVDQHRPHPRLAQRPRRVHRAVVELDPLADPDRP